MKKLLLRIAHFIIRKYGVVPLELKDKVMYNGTIFEVQACHLSHDYFKKFLRIEMSDCFMWIDTDHVKKVKTYGNLQ